MFVFLIWRNIYNLLFDHFLNERIVFHAIVLIPSRYLAKADCRAKPGGAYFLSVGDTVFSPPTTDARLTIQFISLPTFHLEVRRILVFLIKLPSFLKQIFHIYHFLEEKHFYKKNLVVILSFFLYNPFFLNWFEILTWNIFPPFRQ